MIQQKVIKSGSSQVVWGVNVMSQVQIPKLELIIFLSQGLTLSTASLVCFSFLLIILVNSSTFICQIKFSSDSKLKLSRVQKLII